MPNYSAAHVYAEEWRDQLQAELDEPTKWKEVCRVDYTNFKVIHNPYLTDPTVQTGTRGSVQSPQAIVETDDNMTITTYKELVQHIDWANLAQSSFFNQMDIAKRQGILLNEQIESSFYGDHASLTDFGLVSIGSGGAATDTITVSTTNIYKIVSGVRREILEANGASLLQRNGLFFIWRPADFEYLEQFAQANGFTLADEALRAGLSGGVKLLGATHYTSNLLTANHVIAGVKNTYNIGILKATYGKIIVNPYNPGVVSGVSISSRVDYGIKAWTKVIPVLFDINVA